MSKIDFFNNKFELRGTTTNHKTAILKSLKGKIIYRDRVS